jgi:hypothetical protein
LRETFFYSNYENSYKAKPQSLTSALSRVIANKRLHACGWRLEKSFINFNKMVIRSQAKDTSLEGSETTGEVESS